MGADAHAVELAVPLPKHRDKVISLTTISKLEEQPLRILDVSEATNSFERGSERLEQNPIWMRALLHNDVSQETHQHGIHTMAEDFFGSDDSWR
jgi:hypothetical protein